MYTLAIVGHIVNVYIFSGYHFNYTFFSIAIAFSGKQTLDEKTSCDVKFFELC